MSDRIVYRKGRLVELRPFVRADVPRMTRWMNDPNVTQYVLTVLPTSEREEEAWVDRSAKDDKNVVLGIVDSATSTLIGSIGLHRIDWRARTATTGTVIGEKEYWGRGYGTDAKMLLLDVAFNALGLYGVLSRAFVWNTRSLAYSKKCGYREVGRLPSWLLGKDGERHDEVLLIVTRDEWLPHWHSYKATMTKERSEE